MGFTKKTGDCYVYFSCSKMLLDRAEIPNLMVKRYPVKKSAHFWNLVQLDGKWYHCDATVYKDHPEMYFMCTDDEIREIIISESETPTIRLVKAALENGGEDNVTCVIVELAENNGG